ncbi:MAG: hypothetical protein PWP51_536 [Clostridiales bacterium]|jgi:hypothetical protein|nr:hypothetical protein [Clostridiales bacterium]MDN5297983.1 hypothetical protein [Clostridiales bacterium]
METYYGSAARKRITEAHHGNVLQKRMLEAYNS